MKFFTRTTFAPTRRLAYLCALLSPIWLLSGSRAGFVIAAGVSLLLFAAVLFDAAFTPSRAQLSVQRELARNAGLGDETEGRYVVDSRWPFAARVTIHDSLPRALGRDASEPRELVVPARGSIALHFHIVPRERGPHALGPVALAVRGMLGLAVRTVRYQTEDSVLVMPSLGGVRKYRMLSLQHRLRDAGVRVVRRRGQGTTFANLREYARGDDPRHIDWKATARRGTLVSREFTVEQGQTIIVAIDAGRMMTQLSEGRPRFEYALSSALVLADVAIHSRDQLGLMIFDDAVRAFIPPGKGGTALASVRAALVSARASMVEPDYAMAFRTIEARHRKRSLIVMFTDVIDSRSSQAIVAHTTRSVVRHLPLVVALRNDQLTEAADPAGKTSSGGVFESAAAEELVSAREEALLKMRRAGVSVLDVSPQRMTAAVINRYLDLKARSSL